MRRASRDLDLEMQAAVVGGDNAVGEACRDDEIRLGDVLLDEIAGTDQAAGLLVEGEVQFDRARQRQAAVLQGQQRVGVGGEVGLGDGHAAPVHDAIHDFGGVGRMRPAVARRHHIAVRIERDGRSRPEAVAHHQVGGADHAVGGDAVLRDRDVARPRSRDPRAVAPQPRRSAGSRPADCRTAHRRVQRGTSSAPRAAGAGTRECSRLPCSTPIASAPTVPMDSRQPPAASAATSCKAYANSGWRRSGKTRRRAGSGDRAGRAISIAGKSDGLGSRLGCDAGAVAPPCQALVAPVAFRFRVDAGSRGSRPRSIRCRQRRPPSRRWSATLLHPHREPLLHVRSKAR